MSFATEITRASTTSVAAARAAAIQSGATGLQIGAAALEGKWISIAEIMVLAPVTTLIVGDRFKADTLLAPYSKAGWMIEPGAGADLDAMLGNTRFRIGGTGSASLNDAEEYKQLVTVLRVVDGLIEAASLFVAHGQPTAPKSKKYDGIAVKFETDHLCSDIKAAAAATERRAIARSTMIQEGEATLLSKEMDALNKTSYFQYVEAYLQQIYNWAPSYMEVDAICYVSRESLKVAWEMTGTPSTVGGAIDRFSKPAKATGHLIYAVKPDQADSNAAIDPGKCKRLLYHFEGLLANPDTPPGDTWVPVTVDAVLKVAKLKTGMETAIRAAAVRCYYRASDV